eukprot:m.1156708 g.1156708  ORF g.1156708 m.1156708 type:complete len:171 (+) comp24494_c0_seq21:1628-2140(+)
MPRQGFGASSGAHEAEASQWPHRFKECSFSIFPSNGVLICVCWYRWRVRHAVLVLNRKCHCGNTRCGAALEAVHQLARQLHGRAMVVQRTPVPHAMAATLAAGADVQTLLATPGSAFVYCTSRDQVVASLHHTLRVAAPRTRSRQHGTCCSIDYAAFARECATFFDKHIT